MSLPKMKFVAFDPLSSKSNSYIEIIKVELQNQGVSLTSLDSVFSSFKVFRQTKTIHLNWYENVRGSEGIEFVKRFIKLILLKLANKQIIWTMHNKKPHDQRIRMFSSILMKLLANFSSNIVVHSKLSEVVISEYYGKQVRKKVYYIPHPEYIDHYGPGLPNTQDSSSKALHLLFLGAVKKYKNLELLIEAVQTFDSSKVVLRIAGKPINEEYKQYIQSIASNHSNISLELRFIDDIEIPSIISQSDMLIFPYDIKSSLNSGSVILAFSYHKTVICPEIGTIKDLLPSEDILSYSYDDTKDHYAELVKTIGKAIEIKQNNPQRLFEMGNRMFDIAKAKFNKTLVAGEISNLYID